MQLVTDRLVGTIRCRRHVQLSADQLLALAVIGHPAEIVVGERPGLHGHACLPRWRQPHLEPRPSVLIERSEQRGRVDDEAGDDL